jgi:hypothetical protein
MNGTYVLHDIYQSCLEFTPMALNAEQVVNKTLAQKPSELPERMPKVANDREV